MTTRRSAVIFIFSLTFVAHLEAYLVNNDPYRHAEILDQDGRYQLEWLVDWEKSLIIFNVTAKTKGYVGLGLSRKGKMSGADIVIGGVLPNGQPYFSDRYAIANQVPVEDSSQDWKLHAAWESNSHTFLSFSRPFESCDEDHDLPIHDDVIGLLWAFGEKDDEIEYHFQNRGVFYVYLLDPDLTPRQIDKTKKSGLAGDKPMLGNWNVWKISQQQVVPAKDTTYLCNLFKTPVNRKRHIVGFRTIIPNELARRHIHHYMFYRCVVPIGQDPSKVFQHLMGTQEECYLQEEPIGQIPTRYCSEVVHVWGVGQRPIFFPEHVGLPIYPNEYFVLQTHYDNPDSIAGIQVNHTLEIFYSDNLRKHDAATLVVGTRTPGSPSILVPPNSLAHEIYGHCSAECTRQILPPTGVRIFANFLHTHLAGRGIRRMHFRGNKELPWLASDDNYNFNYQQIRILREERKLLPGDSIIQRCIYENTDRNGNVTVGGYSTRDEMCSGFVWYYDKILDRAECWSTIRSDTYREFLQIYNTSWSNSHIENVVTSPLKNTGLLVSEVGYLRMNWTLAKRKQLEEYHRYLPQVSSCRSLIINENEKYGSTKWTRSNTPPIPWKYSDSKLSATGQNSKTHLDPNLEFISFYPKDIVPYKRPSACV